MATDIDADTCGMMHDHDLLQYLKIYLTQAFIFMENYKWISNSYVAEFFTQNLWEKLPLSWRHCFDECTLEDIANNILHCGHQNNRIYKCVWPLSLLSFVVTCHSLALERNQHDVFGQPDVLPKELSYSFKKHMKPKKQHELSLLPKLIHLMCERNKVKNIVDVGSGLGHLARVLAYRYGYNVTAVERSASQLPLAEKFDRQIEEELKRFVKEVGIDHQGEVKHVAKEIHPGISSDEFCSLFDHKSDKKSNVSDQVFTSAGKDDKKPKCILIGLHTCGDLASTMLRVFNKTPEIVGIVSVSCCYFRMTIQSRMEFENHSDEDATTKLISNERMEEPCCFPSNIFSIPNLYDNYSRLQNHDKIDSSKKCWKDNPHEHSQCSMVDLSNEKFGFPLSKFLQSMTTQPLKYKSLETACHFVDDYVQKLLSQSPNLKLHCYRAVMEVFLRYINPELVLTAIRCKKIKNASSMTFEEYARKVMERLDIPFESSHLVEINYRKLLSQSKYVTIFHSLALLMGPVIESIVLVDKQVYLLESGFEASLIPVFNPEISPRNFVIVADKNESRIF